MSESYANPVPDLEAYLIDNDRFKFRIYNRPDVQYIANLLGLSPKCIRSELKKMGYRLIKNKDGRVVWENEEDKQENLMKEMANLDECIAKYETRQLQFYDRLEITRIARKTDTDPGLVRAALRRKGYKLIKNPHDIAVWIKDDSLNHFRQLLVFSCSIEGCLMLSKFIEYIYSAYAIS